MRFFALAAAMFLSDNAAQWQNVAAGDLPGSGALTISTTAPLAGGGSVALGATRTLTVAVDADFGVSAPLTSFAAGKVLNQTVFTAASTLTSGSIYTPIVVGVGAGNLVLRLCSDGTTCGAGNVYLTCTNACTATVGVAAACAVTKAAVPATTTMTWEVGTACATTNPFFNVNAHRTIP